jgi:hypothetical protein
MGPPSPQDCSAVAVLVNAVHSVLASEQAAFRRSCSFFCGWTLRSCRGKRLDAVPRGNGAATDVHCWHFPAPHELPINKIWTKRRNGYSHRTIDHRWTVRMACPAAVMNVFFLSHGSTYYGRSLHRVCAYMLLRRGLPGAAAQPHGPPAPLCFRVGCFCWSCKRR